MSFFERELLLFPLTFYLFFSKKIRNFYFKFYSCVLCYQKNRHLRICYVRCSILSLFSIFYCFSDTSRTCWQCLWELFMMFGNYKCWVSQFSGWIFSCFDVPKVFVYGAVCHIFTFHIGKTDWTNFKWDFVQIVMLIYWRISLEKSIPSWYYCSVRLFHFPQPFFPVLSIFK